MVDIRKISGSAASLKTHHSKFEDQIVSRRLQRVPSFCTISAIGWLSFAVFYGIHQVYFTRNLCVVISTLHLLTIFVSLKRPQFNWFLANFHLAVSTSGLTIDALFSGVADSYSYSYFCCVILIAAHQSGWRVALKWTLVHIGILSILYFGLDGTAWPQYRQQSHLFGFAMAAGLFMLLAGLAIQSDRLATSSYRVSLQRSSELQHLAHHDQLTQLSNLYDFREELKARASFHRETGKHVGLILLDVDEFKSINDTLGHPAGDTVLCEVAERLQRAIGESDVAARLGGDEFAVIATTQSIEELGDLALRIRRQFEDAVTVNNVLLEVTISIGYASIPEHTDNSKKLQLLADLAMYESKSIPGNSAKIYSLRMTEKLTRRKQLTTLLVQANNDKQFEIVYQPQVSVAAEQIIGCEALLRWSPTMPGQSEPTPVSPAEFIPLLESTGLINEVGKWVLEEACRQVKQWNLTGLQCPIAVNVSPVQFHNADFVPNTISIIQSTGICPTQLDIEITEGVMVERVSETREKLKQLKNFGVTISVDDFGTGYSSLAYLKHLPLDRLKIDREFIKDFPTKDDGTIASTIISLAKLLNFDVIAEGVETSEQHEFLKRSGCNNYQGFYFSKPLTPQACTELLISHSGPGKLMPLIGEVINLPINNSIS